MTFIPNVTNATEATVALLKEGRFKYAIIGGLAIVLRGHDRFTQDVDALVWDLDDRLEEFAALLVAHGFQTPTPDQLRLARATRVLRTAWKGQIIVDFMLGSVPFEREALDNDMLPTERKHHG